MPRYWLMTRYWVERTFEVDADNEQEAKDRVLAGEGQEVDGIDEITSVMACPEIDEIGLCDD